jgi:hypothetical protein
VEFLTSSCDVCSVTVNSRYLWYCINLYEYLMLQCELVDFNLFGFCGKRGLFFYPPKG